MINFKNYFLVPCFFIVLIQTSYSNYMSLRNVTIVSDNTGAQTSQVRFNISWENSWKDDVNWDAAWVFIKFKDGSGNWKHATLSSSGHNGGTGTALTIEVPSDNLGAYIYRTSNGAGHITQTDMEVQWDYGVDGVVDMTGIEFRMFAMEMVYIPQGSFAIGDGNGTTMSDGSFRHLNFPYYVIVNENLSPELYGNFKIDGDGGLDFDADGTIDNPDFPTGYKSFYIMKYEITQGQYSDFLNTVTTVQQTYLQPAGDSRMTISKVSGVYYASHPDRGCNGINMVKGMAYADWAGLRPMTELEYEKSCRGPLPAIYGEFAWGTPVKNGRNALVGIENGAEKADIPQRNSGYSIEAYRVGLYAEDTTTRINSGASYYGVMDMSSNLAEYYVSAKLTTNRTFTGLHGNGVLAASGDPDVVDWDTSDCAVIEFIVSKRSGAYSQFINYAHGIRLGRSAY